MDKTTLLTSIREELRNAMKSGDGLGKDFICKQDVAKVWSHRQGYSLDVLLDHPQQRWSSREVRILRNEYLEILSITVWINATEKFRELFESLKSQDPPKRDCDLPLSRSDLLPLEPAERDRFLRDQELFNPFVIRETSDQQTYRVPIEGRLPFSNVAKIGAGAYGNFKRVEVPPNYLIDKAGRSWDKVSTLTFAALLHNLMHLGCRCGL